MNRRAVVAGFAALVVVGTASAVAAGEGSASGEAKVDGAPLVLAHAYLFHAPDAFDSQQVNAVAVLTAAPLDAAALAKATTLGEALDLAPERVVVEVAPGSEMAKLSICHPGFGDGNCYSTSLYPPEWSRAQAAEGHLAGSLVTFTGEEEEVLGKFRLFYLFEFDAAPVRDFERRR